MRESGQRPVAAKRAAYPPEPWELKATIHGSLWLVSASELPPLPTGLEPVRCFGRALLGAVWVVYRPGGALAYNELAAVVPTHRGLSVGVTVTDIWVDSPASLAGGRELWAIPKELARFEVADGESFEAAAWEEGDGRAIASLRFEPTRRLLRFPTLPLSVVQRGEGGLQSTSAQVRGTAFRGHAQWSFDPHGRLARWPTGDPFLSFRVDDAYVCFGQSR